MINITLRKSVGRALSFASLLSSSPSNVAFSFQPRLFSQQARRSLSSLDAISEQDIDYMKLALDHAKKGFGQTFPNPAVGCVLVRSDTQQVIGAGFHPRAGFPHAEVFALLQATGHVTDGVAAAESVVLSNSRKRKDNACQDTFELVKQLTEQYASAEGPHNLFSGRSFENMPVVAYVTLEPCCHYGKTPPCAASFVEAKVTRVVVGFRDPNPRVDGGGVELLRGAGIQVDMMADCEDKQGKKVHQDCANLVSDFVKRISGNSLDYSNISGAMRRALRSYAGRLKTEKAITELDWTGESVAPADGENPDWEALIHSLPIDPSWLESIDQALWKNEVVLLRLNKAAKKKQAAKFLGEAVAIQLQAHIAQTVGHTVLLYRPGKPPILDLETLGRKDGE